MIQAHYTTETKTNPQKIIAQAPVIPAGKVYYSDKEAEQAVRNINTDIYEGDKKKKRESEFNKPLFFKILAGVALVTAGIACLKKFFRKS